MFSDDFRFCYRAPFDLSYKDGPIDKFSHFKYENYCVSAFQYFVHTLKGIGTHCPICTQSD